jgi:hypothetical protein
MGEWWEATGEIAEVQRVGEERDEGELEGGKRERRERWSLRLAGDWLRWRRRAGGWVVD